MPAQLEFFSDAMIALNKEIQHHPDLQEQLNHMPTHEMEVRLACIAAFCNVAMDGYFFKEELDEIAAMLFNKLREKRTLILTPFAKGVH